VTPLTASYASLLRSMLDLDHEAVEWVKDRQTKVRDIVMEIRAVATRARLPPKYFRSWGFLGDHRPLVIHHG
jgi:hypothetical protein